MHCSDTRFYIFDEFILDVAERRLRRNGEFLPLTPKAFQTLVVLLKNSGSVVEKDALLDEVWPDTFVEEATLAQNVSTLRKTLGSKTTDQFIATVPRRGYRFVAAVEQVSVEEIKTKPRVSRYIRKIPYVRVAVAFSLSSLCVIAFCAGIFVASHRYTVPEPATVSVVEPLRFSDPFVHEMVVDAVIVPGGKYRKDLSVKTNVLRRLMMPTGL